MSKVGKKSEKSVVETKEEQVTTGMDRRGFLGAAGLGAAGVATASATGLLSKGASAAISAPDTGITPGAESVARMAPYTDSWNRIAARPFGGFNFALGYIGEGVDMMDPKQDKPNPSGLFESANPAIVSGVGDNETDDRSAEYWYRGILNWSNETIANDFWSAINYMRRMWALDLDDPETDGIQLGDGSRYRYPGSPNPNDEISLWSPRIARDGKGGYVRMAPTLLAPSVGYTVVFRAGRDHPNYTGGTTARSPEDPGKVRDGGIWGGTIADMDVLKIMQDVEAGNRTYTTPGGNKSDSALWGQFWRRVAPLENVNISQINPDTAFADRPAPRSNWPIGYLPSGTDYFWGNYDLKFGEDEPTVVLHYESQIPTRFRDFDGVPEAFICELTAHPGGTDMPADQVARGFKDTDGSLSGFADLNDPNLNGQNQFGHGRVHGTSYPRGVDAQGRTTFHLRNWLLFPPRLNAVNSINDTVPGKGILSA
ncbi:MAG: hypothetical protein GKS02_09795 [Alphaproteobacteria bacterium]|nr:hypothetical protein [Alphaproteobacteria bacterium]